ncbi:hypothetical protein CR166_00615 [Ligilactobacillus salivarius]|uniref:hypothetical protein n=1 Tax=Ligilactobacillus salivarius TaxID=1624 RepID=UPI000C15CED5|nr:hypothetical protein [Ligilactobacillus salivarius]PHY96003.1 hypothetical protein CR166_00615 [Ligilactobacillus salivarius]
MKKSNSILMIIVIVIIASLVVWKVGIPSLNSKNKEISSEKVSKKVKKESKKTKKKEISKAKSSTTETSSSVESEPSSESSSESTSSVQPSVKYPALQNYAGKTYYAVDTDIGFPTTFTITSDTETLVFDGKHELIKSVVLGDSGFIALVGETGHSMGTTLSFEFRPLGSSDEVEVVNQGQYLTYSTTMPE